MTNQEAIDIIKRETAEVYTDKTVYSDKIYEFADALQLAIAALEKQEPKKPMLNFVPNRLDRLFGTKKSGYTCRHCGNVCLTREISERNETYYCWHCGQKLDWESEVKPNDESGSVE